MRVDLYNRSDKLGPAGWGYQCDSLTFKEYKEVTKLSKIIRLPKDANSIYVYDWYEIDFRRTVEFNIPINYNLSKFYRNDSTIINNLKEIKYNDYVGRTTFRESGRLSDVIQIKFDTLLYKRLKYEVSDS